MDKELVEKINYYAKKEKKEGLNKKEEEEREKLRKKYIEQFKKNLKSQLDNIEIK